MLDPKCVIFVLPWQFNGVDANTLYWEIYEVSKAHHFRLESHDDQRYHLELEFVSPLCQYSDILSIQVQSVGGGGAEAVVLPSYFFSHCPPNRLPVHFALD